MPPALIIARVLLYRLVFGLALILYAPYALARQALGIRRVGDWRARLGRRGFPNRPGSIWIHAVSVGEVGAARAILREIRSLDPAASLVLSSSTAAGLERARACPDADESFAFPFDLERSVEAALAAVEPSIVLLTETEIWPLFLERCARRGIPVAVVNGRLSDRSAVRYGRLRPIFGRSFSSISMFLMQSAEDARRLEGLGVDPRRIRVTGNVKFDAAPAADPSLEKRLRAAAGSRPVIVAGSTHEGEEEALLDALSAMIPRPLLVLAPRRPERFEAVARLASGGGRRVERRTRDSGGEAEVYLLDTVGELPAAYGAASLGFVGGTLTGEGGHNPIEAWARGVPILHGPSVGNARQAFEEGDRTGAAIAIGGPAEAARIASALFADAEDLARRGRAAAEIVDRNRGAARAAAEAALSLRRNG
jgi:3-deoxy-D-manno-octulosonic-acid transferase